MSGYVLAGFIALQNPTQPQFANPEREALRHLRKAAYIELGLDEVVDRAEHKYLRPVTDPVVNELEPLVPYVEPYAWVGVLVQIGVEQRFSYTWEF